MRKVFLGFDQKKVVEDGLEIKDLVILRFIVDGINEKWLVKKNIDGEVFYWVKMSAILDTYPIIDLKTKDSVRRRLKVLVEKGYLKYKLYFHDGKYTFYNITSLTKEICYGNKNRKCKNYEANNTGMSKQSYDSKKKILYKESIDRSYVSKDSINRTYINDDCLNGEHINNGYISRKSSEGDQINKEIFNNKNMNRKVTDRNYLSRDFNSNSYNYREISNNETIEDKFIYKEFTDNKIIYNKEEIEEVVEYLNFKIDSKYKATSKGTNTYINSLIEDGFTIEDFKTVIDKKYNEWAGTEYEKYLRPSTLFKRQNFEEYLNQKEMVKAECDCAAFDEF